MRHTLSTHNLRAILRGAVIAWFVVTYSGQRVAGPFTLLSDCTDLARVMAMKYYTVSAICRSF